MTTVTADLKDVAGVSDNTRWIFATPLREGSDGSVITSRRVPVQPVNGVLTVDLDPGYCEVHFGGKKLSFDVPDTASADLWDLLAAAIAFPPETSQSKVAAAIAAYLDLNPFVWEDVAPVDGSGKLLPEVLPDLALVQFKGTKADQAAMLATPGELGDWVIRSDTSTTWVISGSDPTQLASWTQYPLPNINWSNLSGRPPVVGAGATATDARAAIAAAPTTDARDQTLAAATVTKTTDYQTRPTWPAVVLIGDSITDYNHGTTAWNGSSGSRAAYYQANGFFACAMIWNRQQASWIDAGIGTQTSAQGLARFDTDVSVYRPEVVLESFGTNDIFLDRTAAQVFADKLAMWRKAWAFGAKVITSTCPPRDAFTATQARESHKLNAMLRRFARTHPIDFALVDWWAVLADPLTGNYKAGYAADGVHPYHTGAWALAKAYEAALDRFLPEANPPLAMSNVNDTDNLLTNPLLTGTAGSKSTNKGLTGNAATSWNATSSGTDATLTAALSKVARSDGFGDWQQVNITVAPAATSTVTLFQTVTGWSAGDVIQACVEFETDAANFTPGTLDAQLYCYDGSSVFHHTARAHLPGNATTLLVREEQGVLLTPPIEIPPGVTTVQLSLVCGSLGVTRFGRPSIRKLAAA